MATYPLHPGSLCLPDNVKMVGESGQFYTVLTIEDSTNISPENVLVRQTSPRRTASKRQDRVSAARDVDEFFCGRCKQTFFQLEGFLNHKLGCQMEQEQGTVTYGTLEEASSPTNQQNQIIFIHKDEMLAVSLENQTMQPLSLNNIDNPQPLSSLTATTENTAINPPLQTINIGNSPGQPHALTSSEIQPLTSLQNSISMHDTSSQFLQSHNRELKNLDLGTTNNVVGKCLGKLSYQFFLSFK